MRRSPLSIRLESGTTPRYLYASLESLFATLDMHTSKSHCKSSIQLLAISACGFHRNEILNLQANPAYNTIFFYQLRKQN